VPNARLKVAFDPTRFVRDWHVVDVLNAIERVCRIWT
jgi:hypothetical protein